MNCTQEILVSYCAGVCVCVCAQPSLATHSVLLYV